MPPLYDDTGPPLLLAGYASVFGLVYGNAGQLERVAPGAFQFPGNVRLDFDHQGRCLASTYGGSLVLWQDGHGLAFEAALRPDWTAISLMRGIRAGTFRGCSFKNLGDGRGAVETVEQDGRMVHEIRRLNVDEISITTSGANASACCWLGDEGADELPAWIAEARARWAVGKQSRYLAATRPKARTKGKPPASVMASVDRVLALAAGWNSRRVRR